MNPYFTNGSFHVFVPTVAMKTYYLESTPSLYNPEWSPAASVSGDGTLKELVDVNAAAPQLFYRVGVQ
jgi:hypothetical protein